MVEEASDTVTISHQTLLSSIWQGLLNQIRANSLPETARRMAFARPGHRALSSWPIVLLCHQTETTAQTSTSAVVISTSTVTGATSLPTINSTCRSPEPHAASPRTTVTTGQFSGCQGGWDGGLRIMLERGLHVRSSCERPGSESSWNRRGRIACSCKLASF